MDIKQKIEMAELHLRSTRSAFEAFLVDETFSLEERWSTFVSAPSYLKNREYWIVYFKNLSDELFDEYREWQDRGRFIHCTDIAEWIEESKNLDPRPFMEEVLTRNLEGFMYDW